MSLVTARIRPIALGFAGLGMVGALAGCSTSGGGSVDTSAVYKDGSYHAVGSYQAPSGTESIQVDLTLQGDKVTAVKVTPNATSGNPVMYQTQFAGGIAAEVVGKDIDTISTSRVAGSSLTSGGFNAAVKDIKSQAIEH